VARQNTRRLSDRETIVLGVVCMALAAGLCLSLSICFGREPTEQAQAIRGKMSAAAANAIAVSSRPDGTPAAEGVDARPTQMNMLVADLGRAEMDLRRRRGIAMVLSMAVATAIFLGLRAVRARLGGRARVGLRERGGA